MWRQWEERADGHAGARRLLSSLLDGIVRDKDDEAEEVPAEVADGAEGGDGVVNATCTIPDAEGRCELYELSYRAQESGEMRLELSADGAALPQSPLRPLAYPPATHSWPNASTLVAMRNDWRYGDTLTFQIVPRNYLGQRTNSCDTEASAVLVGSDAEPGAHARRHGALRRAAAPSPSRTPVPLNSRIQAQVECKLEGLWTYVATVDTPVEDGAWVLHATIGGQPPLHSPLPVTVRPGISPKDSYLNGDGASEAIAGVPASVTLHLMMHNNVSATDCSEPAVLVLLRKEDEEKVAGESVGGKADGEAGDGAVSAAERIITGELKSCANGVYEFTYTAVKAGVYALSLVVGHDKTLVGDRTFPVEVFPGELSSLRCGVFGGKLGAGSMVYGSSVTFGLYLRDSYGNYISCEHYKRGLAHHNITEVASSLCAPWRNRAVHLSRTFGCCGREHGACALAFTTFPTSDGQFCVSNV